MINKWTSCGVMGGGDMAGLLLVCWTSGNRERDKSGGVEAGTGFT